MTNPNRPLREITGSPILAMKPIVERERVLVTTYIIHKEKRNTTMKLVHIPGCSDYVLWFVNRLTASGYKEVWIDGACHVMTEEGADFIEGLV